MPVSLGDGANADELREWLGVDTDAEVSAWLADHKVPFYTASENRPVTTWSAIIDAYPDALKHISPEPPCALYRHYDKEGTLLYVGISLNPVARLQQHRRGAHWFYDIARIDVEYFATRDDAIQAEAATIVSEHPLHNLVGIPK
jgi:hypothetical protein